MCAIVSYVKSYYFLCRAIGLFQFGLVELRAYSHLPDVNFLHRSRGNVTVYVDHKTIAEAAQVSFEC